MLTPIRMGKVEVQGKAGKTNISVFLTLFPQKVKGALPDIKLR